MLGWVIALQHGLLLNHPLVVCIAKEIYAMVMHEFSPIILHFCFHRKRNSEIDFVASFIKSVIVNATTASKFLPFLKIFKPLPPL